MIRSLRYRLLISASLCSAAVLALLGISVYAAMRHFLVTDFDTSLRSDARLLTTMVDVNDGRTELDFNREQMPDFASGERSRYFQVWRHDGTVLERSPSLGDRNLPRVAPTTAESATEIELPNAHVVRAVSLNYTIRQRGRDERRNVAARTVNILVAAEPIEVNHTLKLLAWMLSILCATAVLIMGVVLLQVVGRGVRPVNELANSIESVRESDLTRRLPRGGVPTELTPMVDKLNGLLGRLQAAFSREKSFTADVAHELRTPLAGLRVTLEVCRSRAREPAAYEAAIDECRGITDHMEAMVESLLLLARSDAGQVTVACQLVDLCRVVSENWSLVRYRAEKLGLQVSLDMPESLAIHTDPEKVAIVLRNVFDNAVSYVDPGGQVRVTVRPQEDNAVVEIANTGSQIAAEDAPRLFERFWRGDAARSDSGIHCGLGLSLCQRLITLLKGEILVESEKGGEFLVRLRLTSNCAPNPPASLNGAS